MHPRAWLEFDVLVRSCRDITQLTQACPGVSIAGNNAAVGPQAVNVTHRRLKESGLFGFGEGDPLLAACESANITVNGSSLSTPSPTLWSRPFIRANLTSVDAQEIFGQCGGCFDAYDSTAVKCFTEGYNSGVDPGGVNQSYGYGFTGDSGVQRRCKNFYNQIVQNVDQGQTYKGAAVDARGLKIVKIRWPVTAGGLLNPWLGADVPRRSPAAGLPFGLANMNQVQLSLLFRANALETLIRDYGQGAQGANDIGFGGLNEIDDTLTSLRVDTDSIELVVRYYRLAPSRQVPASQASKIWRPMVSLGASMPKASGDTGTYLIESSGIVQIAEPNSETMFYDKSRTFLMPSGRDAAMSPFLPRVGAAGTAVVHQTPLNQVMIPRHDKYYEVEWANLQYPMLPSQIMICAPKDSYMFSHRNITAARALGARSVLSRDSSLSIRAVSISVNTTENTYKYSRDLTRTQDVNLMNSDTLLNVQKDFFNGDQDAFTNRGHFILLDTSQYCPIPQMSSGVSSPVQITIRVQFQNTCVYTDAYSTVRDIPADAGAAVLANTPAQPSVSADLIRSRPVVVAFFQHSTIQLAPSSATISVQSYSQASAAEILAQNT
jgi:hypothetical protein